MNRAVLVVIAIVVATANTRADTTVSVNVDIDATLARVGIDAPAMNKFVRGAVRRARRAIAIGPTVGVFGATFPSPGENDAAITFGLGAEVFKLPVLPDVKALIMARAKAKLREQLAAQPQRTDIDQLAREVWDETLREILEVDYAPRTIERPRLTLALEGNRFLDAEVWAVRLRAGIGVWKLTVGGSLGVAFTDPETSIYTGLEVGTHLLLSKQPRASVIDVFVRGDFEVKNRDLANLDMYVLGARFLLDVI